MLTFGTAARRLGLQVNKSNIVEETMWVSFMSMSSS